MTATATMQDRWSGYRQQQYINIIERVTKKPCDLTVITGIGQYHNERVLRARIEKLSGKKFVFGYDPTDSSMVEGNDNTYGWFLSNIDVDMTWTTEVSEQEVSCEDEADEWHTHEVTTITDPFGFTHASWTCDISGADIASIVVGFTHEGDAN
jgi:hypothetical protein